MQTFWAKSPPPKKNNTIAEIPPVAQKNSCKYFRWMLFEPSYSCLFILPSHFPVIFKYLSCSSENVNSLPFIWSIYLYLSCVLSFEVYFTSCNNLIITFSYCCTTSSPNPCIVLDFLIKGLNTRLPGNQMAILSLKSNFCC